MKVLCPVLGQIVSPPKCMFFPGLHDATLRGNGVAAETHTQGRMNALRTQAEAGAMGPQARERQAAPEASKKLGGERGADPHPRQELTPPRPWFWTSAPWNRERMDAVVLNHPVCANVLVAALDDPHRFWWCAVLTVRLVWLLFYLH